MVGTKIISLAFVVSSLIACSEAPEKLNSQRENSVYSGTTDDSLDNDQTVVTVFDATAENGGIPADEQALALRQNCT